MCSISVPRFFVLKKGVYREYDETQHQLYTKELLQEILLGLHSMCQGAEAQFFNGHTNVTSSRFIVFGVCRPVQIHARRPFGLEGGEQNEQL